MRKQITSLLLTLAMLLSLVPTLGVTASAGEMLPFYEVGTYQELRSAILSGKSRIKLKNDINTRDVYASGVGIPEDQMITIGYDADITLDLNGCTLALETLVRGGFSFFTVYGELEIKDSSPSQTGKITGKFPARLASMFRMGAGGGRLTLQSGTLMTSSNKNDVITVGSSGGHVVINGGRICSGIWDTSSASPCGYAVLAVTGFVDVEEMEVTINGGVFDGAVGFFPLSEFTCEEPRFHINGGTFKKDVLLRCGQKTFKTHSPILEIRDGSFEGGLKIYDWGMDLIGKAAQSYPPFKLLGGTFSCTMDLCYEKSSWGFYSPNLDQIIDVLKYERMGPVFAAMFENSAIVKPSGTYTVDNIGKGIDWAEKEGHGGYYQMLLKGTADNPVRIIPDAWGMKSVTLDGKSIDYFKDWKGTVERMDNSTAHTLKFEWYPLTKELKDAGYSYRTECEHYISGSTAVQQTDTIAADKTSHTVTIPKGADPKVYSFALHLNLKKNNSDYNVGIYSNEHIVKLVVSEAPEVKTLTGKVNYTNGAVFGKPILFSGTITPGVKIWECQFQWQRSTDGGSRWTDIPDATDGSYTPGAADMGENVRIRIVITKKGYLGEIVGAPVKVSKATNDKTPAQPNVTAQKNADGTYTAFQIKNFRSDQEYVYTTSAPTSGNGWPTGGTPITSATVNGLNKGSTYYIFTRYKGTDTHQTGSKIISNSVLLDEITMLNRVILTDASGREYGPYGSGNTIYIKKGERMTLTAKTNPVGATTWSGFTFKSQYSASAPFTVTAPTNSVASGSTIPSVTIRGDQAGTGTLAAEYGGYPAPQSYGTWRVHVYEKVSDIGTAADIIVAPSFPDLTMRPGETMPLPEYTVSVYPKGALDNYTLEWRIIKVGSGGAAYSMRDDHMTLENGKIEPTKAHTGSEKTRLELVAVNKTKPTNIRSLSPSVGFYITVGDAPLVELTGLTLTPKKVDLEVGKSYQLSAVKEPANAEGSLTWTSSKPAVAAVDKSGKVTAKGEGTATITVTCGTKSAACTVTVSKPLVPEVPGTSFTDVPAGAYYEEAVGWAVKEGITKGTSDSTFTPDGVCTRAQAVTFLWRAAGSPAAKAGSLPFADVKAGSYYDDAVRWAVENGVTVGTSATTFSPNATCSRAQIVTFLWRAQKSPAAGSANPFDDVAGSAYYADAVQWAVQKNITKGTGATAFSPDANCIRAQIVTFLYRSMK